MDQIEHLKRLNIFLSGNLLTSNNKFDLRKFELLMNKLSIVKFSAAMLFKATERLAKFVFSHSMLKPEAAALEHIHGCIVSGLYKINRKIKVDEFFFNVLFTQNYEREIYGQKIHMTINLNEILKDICTLLLINL